MPGCQQPILPEPSGPQPDPASLIEGVYNGFMATQSPDHIYLWGADGIILLKRIAPAQLAILSLIGFMTPDTVKVYTKGDSIMALPGERFEVYAKREKNLITKLDIFRKNLRTFRPNSIDLNTFGKSQQSVFQPLSHYRSAQMIPTAAIASQVAGFYNGMIKRQQVNLESYVSILAIKPISADTIQLMDRFNTFPAYKVGLQAQAEAGVWSGQSTDGTIKVRIQMRGTMPQQLRIEPAKPVVEPAQAVLDYTWPTRSGNPVFVSSQ